MARYGYIRVSTEEQAQHGFGLQAQREAIGRCRQVFADEGVSGTTIERPGLLALLERVGPADEVAIPNLNRLARSLTIQEAILGRLWDAGASVWAADTGALERDDPDDPMRTALRQIQGVFAQLDRGMLTKRMREGKAVKAARGGYAGGRPPYGFRAEDGTLVHDEAEQAIIRDAHRLRAAGLSLRQVAAELPPARSGRAFAANTLAEVLGR